MIAQLKGIVAERTKDSIILDVGGIGFLVNTSSTTLAAAPQAGESMTLYTVFTVREDAMELFGFATKEEKNMYDKLRGVNGIGPRTALAVLSTFNVRDLSLALLTGDANTLAKAPGIGKKTAQRLVLELKDKVDDADVALTGPAPIAAAPVSDAAQDAIEALLALGYGSQEAGAAIAAVQDQSTKTDELIRLALRSMMK